MGSDEVFKPEEAKADPNSMFVIRERIYLTLISHCQHNANILQTRLPLDY